MASPNPDTPRSSTSRPPTLSPQQNPEVTAQRLGSLRLESQQEEIDALPELNPQRQGPVPEYRNEYDKLVPPFNGEPLALAKYLKACDKIYARFYDTNDIECFQNDLILSSFTSKLGPAVTNKLCLNSIENYCDLRQTLIQTYSDKRDTYTLTLELAKMKQLNEDCFQFHDRICKLLNSQIGFLQTHFPQTSQILIPYMETLALRVFLHGLHEPTGSFLRTRAPTTLGSALSILTNDFNLKASDKATLPQNRVQTLPQVKPRLPSIPFVPRTPVQPQRPFIPFNNNWRGPNQNNFNQNRPPFQNNSNFRPAQQNSQPQKYPSNQFGNRRPSVVNGPAPSFSTRNANFNLITPDFTNQDMSQHPTQEYDEPQPENTQYNDQENAQYDPEFFGHPDFFQNYDYYPNNDHANSYTLDDSENNAPPENSFLGQSQPPMSSTS